MKQHYNMKIQFCTNQWPRLYCGQILWFNI